MASALAKKLRLSPGARALILDTPDGYMKTLGELPEGVVLEERRAGEFGFVQLFVRDKADLDRLIDVALASVKRDGLLWICYPKGSSGVRTDLNRDSLWAALADRGIRPVTQVSIDEVWSAMRFRRTEDVGR